MKGAAAPVESVFDVMEMEDGARRRLLRLGEAELADGEHFYAPVLAPTAHGMQSAPLGAARPR